MEELIMYKTILIDIKNKVGTITLNRPEVSNAFSVESYEEIRNALQELDKNDDVGSIVLTGTSKNFSAGGDIKEFKEYIEDETYIPYNPVITAGRMSKAVRECTKPVIAMINGAAAGAGCSLALACDFRFMTAKSSLVMAFITLGLSGDTGGLYYLEKLVGIGKMTELMMTGAPLAGIEAEKLGVAKLVDDDKLEESTYKFAQRLAKGPLFAFKTQKAIFNELFYKDMDKVFALEAQGMYETSRSEDFKEAVDAFLNRRKPEFKGR
jgi:2-(1,2-epoxy-1,2-dihydrophenyl)acetyl-CoA isomerase